MESTNHLLNNKTLKITTKREFHMQKTQTAPAQKKQRISLTKVIGWTMLTLGAAALIASIIYASQIPAFVGLGLTFWGAILIYIRTEEYIKENLLDTTVLPSLKTINQMLQELDYEGKAIYLPPKYNKDPEANKAYIPKQNEGKMPTPEQIQEQETKLFIENPQGMLLTPLGGELTRLFEKTLETSFTRIDLQHLQEKMPKLFIEDLEISQNFEMETKDDKVHVKIENSIYKNLTKEVERLSKIYGAMGCPIGSAIACALAKATGKPIIVESQKISEDGKQTEIEYRVLEEEQKEK
jgi:hypothetical protein